MKYYIYATLYLIVNLAFSTPSWAKLKVVSTTTTLDALVSAIGKDHVDSSSIAKGTQDPHYIEAKPSYMLGLRDAELIVSVGLELEAGWLPNVVRGARNPKLLTEKHQFQAGSLVDTLQKPEGSPDRAEGDVHAFGNPHFYLDPVRTQKVVTALAEKMALLDPENADDFRENASSFNKDLGTRLAQWKASLESASSNKVITYHKTLTYFLDRFALVQVDSIEPKPGIGPTPRHSLHLIQEAKKQKVKCILNESYFETTAAQRISQEIGGKFKVVPTEVKATANAKNYVTLIDELVRLTKDCLSQN